MPGGGYIKAADLPQVIPVFPLDGVLLLPHGMLPLNVFEPRYLNMIDDVMSGDRIIGMIQTKGAQNAMDDERPAPNLAQVGCAGRITSYAETSDGRYLITLTGVCRFRLGPELPVRTPYRQVRADFSGFEPDLKALDEESDADRPSLLAALKAYLERRGPGQQPGHGPALRRGGETGPAGGRGSRGPPRCADRPVAHRRPGRRRQPVRAAVELSPWQIHPNAPPAREKSTPACWRSWSVR
jgi:Lon protease-like protein